MWALRRASIQFRNRGLTTGTCQICCGKTEITNCCLDTYSAGVNESPERIFDGLLSCTRSYITSSSFLKSHREARAFSFQAGANSNGEDDDNFEDGFSELETPQEIAQEATSGDEIDDENETDAGDKKTSVKVAFSAITYAIRTAPDLPVSTVMDKWVEEGNEVTQDGVSSAMHYLRKRRLRVRALQLSEWLESTKHFEFVDKDYAIRLDLIAKTRGLRKAEVYIEEIPESFRTEIVYSTLLANYVSATNIKKSEELFNKMKDLGFLLSCFSYNQLLLLYTRTVKKKIADVLLLMEKENIKPSLLTYQILIDVKGRDKDITGIEQIIETMKGDGLEPSAHIQALVARYYAAAGLREKAEAVLKDIEEGDIEKNRWIYQELIPIYASLGRDDEVDRIWKVCESRLHECTAVIEAWGHLKKIENAELAFEKMLKVWKKPPAKVFTALLKVYTNHKMLEKGKDLVKQMSDVDCYMGPVTWDAIVKLFLAAGEVEKADTILENAVKEKRGRPLFCTYCAIMEEYAERGDVHNAEKIFQMMRRVGYCFRVGQYKLLLRAYVKANTPAYGFSDRMRADNIIPNQAMARQLAQMDKFKKSPIDDLLE
ncbi:hypothetical protein ACS0TY_025284 [Phlomoides rotata]